MMSGSSGRWSSSVLVWLLSLAGASAPALAEESAPTADESSALGFERTPPRLSFTDGEVSYWRPGADDWTEAQVNTPLAAGDELSTGPGANLELQVGGRAYVRAGEEAQLGLTALEPDYLRLRLAAGTAALDLRELPSGQTLEINTPNAAFTIERPGYYRVEVESGSTKFISRRGGRATMATETGLPEPIGASEQVVITGTDAPVVATYAAPEIDEWDRWNYGRTDEKIAAASSRYVPAGVYGVDDLDRNGDWQVAPTYGAVWVPRVAVGWAPYSAGTWVADPYYGWTWVDDAPWGWAPFHYGRWVYVNSYWAWSPGPRIARPYYSPALVAFYSSPSVSVSVSFGVPSFGWVALGWGEPVVPWWGPRGCRGVARWSGWGGPHFVNNVVVHNNHYVNVNNIHRYEHAGRRGAMVAVDRERFGRGHVRNARHARFDADRLAPVRGGELGVRPGRRSLVASDRRGARPSREVLERRVVTRRDPTRRDSAAVDARGRSRAQPREARTGDPQRDRARGAPGSDLRQGRNAPPPVRVARAETSERRSSVSSRARGRSDASRERAAPPAQQRVERGRRESAAPRERVQQSAPRRGRTAESRAVAPPTRERASQQRAPDRRASRSAAPRSQAEPRSAPRREARPRSQPQAEPRTAPRREARPRSQPRAERAAPAQRRERAAPRAERVAPRESSGGSPSRASRGSAQPDRQQGRERATQPRSSPAPRDSGKGQRGGDGNGRGDSDGPRGRRG